MPLSSLQARMGGGTTRGGVQRKWDGGDKDDDGGNSGALERYRNYAGGLGKPSKKKRIFYGQADRKD